MQQQRDGPSPKTPRVRAWFVASITVHLIQRDGIAFRTHRSRDGSLCTNFASLDRARAWAAARTPCGWVARCSVTFRLAQAALCTMLVRKTVSFLLHSDNERAASNLADRLLLSYSTCCVNSINLSFVIPPHSSSSESRLVNPTCRSPNPPPDPACLVHFVFLSVRLFVCFPWPSCPSSFLPLSPLPPCACCLPSLPAACLRSAHLNCERRERGTGGHCCLSACLSVWHASTWAAERRGGCC